MSEDGWFGPGELWHRLSPWAVDHDEVLTAVRSYLSEPAVQSELDNCEREHRYPTQVRQRLHDLGLWTLFVDPPGGESSAHSKATFVHQSSLCQLIAVVNTSLAISVGVTPFAFLAIYIAGSAQQRAWLYERVRLGAFGAVLLSEKDRGSDLLSNRVVARVGLVDEAGVFQPSETALTHYQVSGRKDLINGGSRHELLTVLVRTRGAAAGTASERAGARDFSLLVVERDGTVSSPQSWETLPVPAVDVASVQFDGTLVPVAQRLGREGEGFGLVQKIMGISRGGVSAFAAGLASRAVALATHHAAERRLYGAPIGKLGAIADHLLRMRALELVVSALSVKAAAAVNFAGPGASHQSALAKYLCGVLTEELVAEGRVLHGARSLLADHPYHRLSADAALVSTFDGTTHVVLENIRWRLAQLAALESADLDGAATLRAMYAAAPQSLAIAARRANALLLSPIDCLRALVMCPGDLPLAPLIELCQTLLALTRRLRDSGRWEEDQGTRLDAAALLAQVEGLCALVELADAPRRESLGLPPLPAPQALRSVVAYAYGWLGGRVAAGLRALSARAGLEAPDSVAAAERVLLPLCAIGRDRYLQRSTAAASEAEMAQPPTAAPMRPASSRLTDPATPSVCALSDSNP